MADEKTEGSATHESIRPALRDLLSQVVPPNLAGAGPEGGLLLCMVPVCLLYAIFTWKGLHPAISQNANPDDWRTVAATAGVETLRVLAIVWLPLIAAFSVRQGFYDRGVWATSASLDRSAFAEQRMVAIGLAVVVAVCGLSGSRFSRPLTAQSVSRFQALLFQGSVPLILFFPTLAVVTIPLVYCTLRAADQRAAGATGAWLGLACAVLVVAMLASHMAIWFGQYRTCTALGPYLLDMAAAGCMRRYGGLDFRLSGAWLPRRGGLRKPRPCQPGGAPRSVAWAYPGDGERHDRGRARGHAGGRAPGGRAGCRNERKDRDTRRLPRGRGAFLLSQRPRSDAGRPSSPPVRRLHCRSVLLHLRQQQIPDH